MKSIVFWSEKSWNQLPVELQEYVHRAANYEEPDCDGDFSVDLDNLPLEIKHQLILQPCTPSKVRDALVNVSVAKQGPRPNWKTTKVKTIESFHKVVNEALVSSPDFQLEVKFNHRWYPARVACKGFQGWTGYYCYLTTAFKIGSDLEHHVTSWIFQRYFEDNNGDPCEVPVGKVLEEAGFRPIQSDVDEFKMKVRKAQDLSEQIGSQMLSINNAVQKGTYQWWQTIESIDFGTEDSPRKVVLEPLLELLDQRGRGWGGDNQDAVILPYVRVFSLDLKRYVYVDIDDLIDYEYEQNAVNRLVLPEAMSKIVRTVFTSDKKMSGDILKHKHGGMVILAAGGPGVGKTLTAEVFAEHTKRPLYVLEVGELGTTPEAVEENLQRVFKRATRWNAVLLFDEADIFMHHRDDNLERNAIVGIFLRLLDYYPGLMFLTTNRVDIIDNAFKSRISLTLEYPDLDKAARTQVWKNFLKIASMKLVKPSKGGLLGSKKSTEVQVEDTGIADLDLNGRQIRNLTRLITLVHDDEVTEEQVNELYAYTCPITMNGKTREPAQRLPAGTSVQD